MSVRSVVRWWRDGDRMKYRRICPLCPSRMTVLMDPGNHGDFVWYCDNCEIFVWNDLMIGMDRKRKYVEE